MRKWEMPKLNLKGSDKQVKWALDIIAGVYTTRFMSLPIGTKEEV